MHALQTPCSWPLKAAVVRFAEETTNSRYSTPLSSAAPQWSNQSFACCTALSRLPTVSWRIERQIQPYVPLSASIDSPGSSRVVDDTTTSRSCSCLRRRSSSNRKYCCSAPSPPGSRQRRRRNGRRCSARNLSSARSYVVNNAALSEHPLGASVLRRDSQENVTLPIDFLVVDSLILFRLGISTKSRRHGAQHPALGGQSAK